MISQISMQIDTQIKLKITSQFVAGGKILRYVEGTLVLPISESDLVTRQSKSEPRHEI